MVISISMSVRKGSHFRPYFSRLAWAARLGDVAIAGLTMFLPIPTFQPVVSLNRITDGSLDFSGGVDSGRVTTIASQANPNGVQRNQLVWAGNATMRGG